MVLGAAYPYERVLVDSARYEKVAPDGKFYAWWEPYFSDEGLQHHYRPFMDLYELPRFKGRVVGLLSMDIPELRQSHIVCVDEIGVVDPADGAPAHIDIPQYVLERRAQGVRFHAEFLAVQIRAAA